jgi:hypothetical protein
MTLFGGLKSLVPTPILEEVFGRGDRITRPQRDIESSMTNLSLAIASELGLDKVDEVSRSTTDSLKFVCNIGSQEIEVLNKI